MNGKAGRNPRRRMAQKPWGKLCLPEGSEAMGRKEGGSLFHQMIQSPELFTLSHRTDKDGKPMEVSFRTRENYYQWLHKEADYFKKQGIRKKSDITKERIQEYADYLVNAGKTASTIHSYLTPLCKVTGVSLQEIEKPLRHGSDFIRSSRSRKTEGGPAGELNRMIGLREDELRRLEGNDIKVKNGVLYVIVRRGKGGKYQEQKVLPVYEKAVSAFFDGSDKRIFTASDMVKGFDYHGQRRALAKEALAYYNHRLQTEPGYRKELYKELARQWHAYNRKHRDQLEPFSYFNKPYRLRGKNLLLAKKQGLPAVLDRLALRAVSVFHLAHWREKVTIQSYYFSR